MVSASALTSPSMAAMRLDRLGSPAAGREVTTAASSVSTRPTTSSRARPSTPAAGARLARSRTSSSRPASRASTALTPLSRLVSRPMVPSTARTMPAPATPAPSMDTPDGSQPRRRGGRSADGSDRGWRTKQRGGGIVIRGGIGRCIGRGVPWSPASGGVLSPVSAAVRTGPGATSSAVGSEVRGRSRAGGGSPEAGGWSWSLVTRPVLCRFAPGMKGLRWSQHLKARRFRTCVW